MADTRTTLARIRAASAGAVVPAWVLSALRAHRATNRRRLAATILGGAGVDATQHPNSATK